MPTPSIQTLRTDAQQVLNLDSISAVRSVVAATLANANAGTPLNPNLTTQQLWNEFYQIVTQPKSDIESIIANQLMKFMYAPPAPGGAGANGQVIFNDGGALAGDPQFLWNKTTNLLTVTGSAAITGAATVGTTLGVTGAATFTGPVVCNGAVTLGDAVGDAITANGSLTAYNGQAPSAIRAAASDYAAVTFDGATTSTRIVSACQAIGTGDFSLWSRFRVPTSFASSPGVLWLTDTNNSTFRANAMGIYLDPGANTLRVFRYGTTPATDNRIATVNSFLTNFVGQVVDVVVTRAGNTLKIYINGTDTAYTETTGGAAPAWGQTVVSDFTLTGAQSSANIFTGPVYRSVVFNRALSASDVTELITVGVNPADQWGTQTAAYTSNFSVNADSWAQNIGNALLTATGNIDGISGVNDTLRFANTDTVSVALQVRRNSTLVTTKRYRISFDYFAETGSGLQFLGLGFFGTRYDAGSSAVVENAWQTGVSLEAVIPLTLLPVASFTTSTGTSTSAFVSAKNVYFKNFVVTRIGAIVDLDFTVGGGTTAFDRSTNGLDGTLFGGVSWTMPLEGQYINGPSTITGDLTTNGNVILGTSGKGIDFSATANGSGTMTSELLDDYEEGNWTGTIGGTTTNPTTPVTSTGRYTKIGRQVFVEIGFSGDTTGASGRITVSGLPFTSNASLGRPGAILMDTMGTFTGSPVAWLGTGVTSVDLYASNSNASFSSVTHNAGAGRALYMALTYTV